MLFSVPLPCLDCWVSAGLKTVRENCVLVFPGATLPFQALGPASAALISLYYKGLFPRPSSPCPVNSHRAKGQTQFTVLSIEVGGGCTGKKGSWTESEAGMTLEPSPQFHICPFICRCRNPDLPMNPNSRDS